MGKERGMDGMGWDVILHEHGVFLFLPVLFFFYVLGCYRCLVGSFFLNKRTFFSSSNHKNN